MKKLCEADSPSTSPADWDGATVKTGSLWDDPKTIAMSIDGVLRSIYGEKLASEWLDLPNTNPLFDGGTPRAFMASHGFEGARKVLRLLASRVV